MRISAKCDYACRALLELSLHWPKKEPLQLQNISGKQNIPVKYLVQIFIQLKRDGLVVSSRGKDGGYLLGKTPDAISLGDVMRCMGGALLSRSDALRKEPSVFSGVWDQLEGAMTTVVDHVTFEDICAKSQEKDKILIFQI